MVVVRWTYSIKPVTEMLMIKMMLIVKLIYWFWLRQRVNWNCKQKSGLQTKRDLLKAQIWLSAAFRWELKEEVKVDDVVPRWTLILILVLVAPNFLLQAPNFHPRRVTAAAAAGESAPLFTSAQLFSAQAQPQACTGVIKASKGFSVRMRPSQPPVLKLEGSSEYSGQKEDKAWRCKWKYPNICLAVRAQEMVSNLRRCSYSRLRKDFWECRTPHIHSLETSKYQNLPMCPFQKLLSYAFFFSCPDKSLRQLYTYPCHSLTHYKEVLLFDIQTPSKSDPRDLGPLRHLIRVMNRHDLTNKTDNEKDKDNDKDKYI